MTQMGQIRWIDMGIECVAQMGADERQTEIGVLKKNRIKSEGDKREGYRHNTIGSSISNAFCLLTILQTSVDNRVSQFPIMPYYLAQISS